MAYIATPLTINITPFDIFNGCAVPQKFIVRNDSLSIYEELVMHILHAQTLLSQYRNSSNYSTRQNIADEYIYVCNLIHELKYQINGLHIKGVLKRMARIAASFKSKIYGIAINLKASFRRVMKLLFKNMDDSSGKLNSFYIIFIYKRIYNTKNIHNAKSISNFN